MNDSNEILLTALLLEKDMLVEVGYKLLETMSKHDVDVTSHTHTHLEDALNELAQHATGSRTTHTQHGSQCPAHRHHRRCCLPLRWRRRLSVAPFNLLDKSRFEFPALNRSMLMRLKSVGRYMIIPDGDASFSSSVPRRTKLICN